MSASSSRRAAAMSAEVPCACRHGHTVVVAVDGGTAVAEVGEQRAGDVDGGTVEDARLEHVGADGPLERVGRAVGDDERRGRAATIRVGEPLDLLEVLAREQHGGAVGRDLARRATTARSGSGDRARRSARRGASPTADRRASRPGRDGDACPPSRCRRGDRRRRRGRSARGPRLHAACRSRLREPVQARRPARCSRLPVSSSSTAAAWPARPISWRTRLRVVGHRSTPADPRRAAVGPQERGQRRAPRVVLPAPFGRAARRSRPSPRRRTRPASAGVVPKDFVEPLDLDHPS